MTNEELYEFAKKGFVDHIRSCMYLLEKPIVDFNSEEIDCLLCAICKEYSFAKKSKFFVDDNLIEILFTIKARLKEFIHDRESMTWMPLRGWDKALVKEFVEVVYINYDYLLCKKECEELIDDKIPY